MKKCKLHCEQQGLKVSSRVKNHHFSKFAILDDQIELIKSFLFKKIPGKNRE